MKNTGCFSMSTSQVEVVLLRDPFQKILQVPTLRCWDQIWALSALFLKHCALKSNQWGRKNRLFQPVYPPGSCAGTLGSNLQVSLPYPFTPFSYGFFQNQLFSVIFFELWALRSTWIDEDYRLLLYVNLPGWGCPLDGPISKIYPSADLEVLGSNLSPLSAILLALCFEKQLIRP